jgi:transcriptional regulator with GAF, ATPase, and Fis domain
MEIVQQKLAWLLAMAAMLILVYKLDLRRTAISRSAISKVRAGLILNLAGALGGVVLKIGFTSESLPHSVFVVLVETVGGYVLGWTLIIWGLIQGLGSFFDSKGDLKTDLAVGKLSKNLSSSLLIGSGPNRIIEEMAADLLQVLSADAITLHRVDEAGQLRLSYSVGLDPGARNLIRMPEGAGSIYQACLASGRPVIADSPFEIALGKRLELSKGLAWSALCIPTAFSGRPYGLVAVYRMESRVFSNDDCEVLRIAGEGLGMALWRQCSDDARRIETRYREIASLAKRYFYGEESLVSAMIKTAKMIHGHIPFERIRLDIMGNGKPQYLDFNLSTGGIVSIGSGYFSKEDHPEFHFDIGSSSKHGRLSKSGLNNDEENQYRFPVNDGNNRMAVLTIKMASAGHESDSLSMLGSALCREIAGFLRRERLFERTNRTGQRLGAIRLIPEAVGADSGLSRFLDNIASAVVDLMPAAICRIFLVDNKQRLLKSVATAQARDLKWSDTELTDPGLDDIDFCRQTLDSGSMVDFSSHIERAQVSGWDYSRLIPQGVRQGICLPLTAGGRTVGLLLVGDARRFSRSETSTEDTLFASAVAEKISMVLMIHKDRLGQSRTAGGMGKLTLKKKGMQSESSEQNLSLSERSRINGPLAGILASCEYLRSCPPEDASEVGRFIDIIQRNAARIHLLTSETDKV